MRIRWDYNDDYLCCRRYLECALDVTAYYGRDRLAHELSKSLPKFPISSIYMKLSNIKQIANEEKVSGCEDISSLYQYSRQCRDAFKKLIKN